MIASYLNQTVQRYPKSGYDTYGKPTLGTAEDVKARFQEKQRRAMNDKGVEFLTDAELWLLPSQDMALDDVVVFEEVRYKVVRVDVKRGLTGDADHKKVLLVRTKENG